MASKEYKTVPNEKLDTTKTKQNQEPLDMIFDQQFAQQDEVHGR